MRRPLPLMIAAVVLSACSPLGGTAMIPILTAAGTDPGELAGLSNDFAAHSMVQSSVPGAFALTPESAPFLTALDRSVDPLRQQLAQSLAADSVVSQGLAKWERSTATAQLDVLKRVAELEATVMGCELPEINVQAGAADQPGTMAFFQPSDTGNGQIVMYRSGIAKGGKYLAIATVVHEMRHAAQYQLVMAQPGDADAKALAKGYSDAWKALDQVSGENSLAYGDYAHLTIEYDAFQTGNQVAAVLSQGSYDGLGFGFVDTHYNANAKPVLNLLNLSGQKSGRDLVIAVNKAEYQAERARGGTAVRPQRMPTPRFRFR